MQTVPPVIYIDSVPSRNRVSGMVNYWARVREQQIPFDSVCQMAMEETGRRASNIASMDLGRRVPEKEVSFIRFKSSLS
jgi:hypothetical protein